MLGGALDDTQAHLGVMVEHLMASMAGEPARVYRVGLHANALLESMAEVVISWQLLGHAEIALSGDTLFHRGKIASGRYLVRDVAPKIAARRIAAQAEDGALMEMDDASF
jgi:hypothetical protein